MKRVLLITAALLAASAPPVMAEELSREQVEQDIREEMWLEARIKAEKVLYHYQAAAADAMSVNCALGDKIACNDGEYKNKEASGTLQQIREDEVKIRMLRRGYR